jgi:hypothetical protein
MFLEKFKNDVEILYYKDPSFIKKVEYSEIVKTLFNTKISENNSEDQYLKKIISNVNIGLLEKGVNKAEKSTLFDTLEEARHYQTQYGGHISILRKLEQSFEVVSDPLDNIDTCNKLQQKILVINIIF